MLNTNSRYETLVNSFGTLNQQLEDGLVLTLLKEHTLKEVEAILCEFIEDEEAAKEILARCHGFIQATA